jgi:hypothetical protein
VKRSAAKQAVSPLPELLATFIALDCHFAVPVVVSGFREVEAPLSVVRLNPANSLFQSYPFTVNHSYPRIRGKAKRPTNQALGNNNTTTHRGVLFMTHLLPEPRASGIGKPCRC